MLVVRSASALEERAADLTTRAKIRNAAIAIFAEEGFDASFRSIAKRVGVSPGLITHHFGSKERLRAECDAEVLRQYTAMKIDAVDRPSDHLSSSLTAPGFAASLVVYILRAIHAGGRRRGLPRAPDRRRPRRHGRTASRPAWSEPSRNEEARLRYMTYLTRGRAAGAVRDGPGPARRRSSSPRSSAGQQDQILPILELFTEGLLARPTCSTTTCLLRFTDRHEGTDPCPAVEMSGREVEGLTREERFGPVACICVASTCRSRPAR